MPTAEVILWSRLKGRQLLGCKFRRQYSVGSFVLDFCSVEIKLGIELDGDSHFQPGAREYDIKRRTVRSLSGAFQSHDQISCNDRPGAWARDS